ncbi:sulfatase-like hydrolase/transferase [Rubripirellula reticaptiva]|uniref:Arylsulfatase n=1 Tax=Rubripirellula reticaptiva TaxID=2528013 RepID=A0A5C6F9B8_9BACT|nr:sulfatase-like hydrolase/transferase [Rubripirellula reticaptiva]TWU58343.1 Arylsulfatase [Rubripirellula reticaptiva]
MPFAIRLVLACCAIACLKMHHQPAQANEKPNILLILADDLGYEDLGFQKSADIKSPNLDRLAAGGIQFSDGHVSASVCSPSRAGLLTGRYQQRFGHEANSPPYPHGMNIDEVTLAQKLQTAGYRTGLVGKWHLGATEAQYPTSRGFDYFYGLREGSRSYFYNDKKDDKPGNHHAIEENGKQVRFDGYLTDELGDQATKFIGEESDKPFFLYLSFTAPHGPLEATKEDLERFSHIENKKRRTYAAMIWAMDRAIGKVLAKLDAQRIADNTMIWFLSDNGGATGNASSNLPLAGHKGIKFEGGIRVPFVLYWKNRFSGGQTFAPMVSSLDILPTCVAAANRDLASSETPDESSDASDAHPLDGVNLLPFLTNETGSVPHQKLFWHKLWFSAMRDGPWKLIYVQDYGYALYNLDDDLSERHNLAASEPGRVAAMTEELNQWKSELPEPEWGEGKTWFTTHSKNHIRIIEGKDDRSHE